jgi:phage gp29-like protein
MGLFDVFKEKTIDDRKPQETLTEDELLEEYSLYRNHYFDKYSDGVEEYTDPVGITTYRQMATQDAQIKAGLLALRLPILAKGFVIKCPLDTHGHDGKQQDKYDEQVAFLEYCFKNMGNSLEETLDQMLSAVPYGFSVAEPVYTKYKEGKWKNKIGLRKAKVLNPTTIKFKMNDYGDILSVVQEIGEKKITIPYEKMIHFNFDSEFGSPYGSSALHAIHKHWYIKDNMYKFANMAYERNGMPLLVGTVKNKNEVGKMRRILDNILGRTGVAISGTDDIKVLDSTKTMDFVNYINHHNMMIMRGLMIPSLLFGNEGSGTGSYALGQSHFDMFLFRLESIQKDLQKVINDKIVKRLIDINFGKQEVYPELQFKPLMDKDRDKLSDIFFKLVNAQIIEPQEEWVRDQLGFPQMSDEHRERVEKELQIKLQMLEQQAEASKKGLENMDKEQTDSKTPAPSKEEEPKGNARSNGTMDSGSHPLNSKGRGNVEKKQ